MFGQNNRGFRYRKFMVVVAIFGLAVVSVVQGSPEVIAQHCHFSGAVAWIAMDVMRAILVAGNRFVPELSREYSFYLFRLQQAAESVGPVVCFLEHQG